MFWNRSVFARQKLALGSLETVYRNTRSASTRRWPDRAHRAAQSGSSRTAVQNALDALSVQQWKPDQWHQTIRPLSMGQYGETEGREGSDRNRIDCKRHQI